MIRSMTGFGSATGEWALAGTVASLRVEARSVNHRFLQVKVRLPGELAFLEPKVEERVRRAIDRGAVSVNVQAVGSSPFEAVAVDADVAQAWKTQLERMAKALDVPAEIALKDLVGLPGVIAGRVDEKRLERGSKTVLGLVDDAVGALADMRMTEGTAIEKDLRKQSAQIAKLVGQIEKRMPKVVRQHHDELKKRVTALLEGREVGLIADRLDVSEELTRLASHGEQLEKLLDKGGAIGRKLDFLIQEFHREANTIGSKCNDASVAHRVVDLKSAIERMREQAQNVE